MTSGIVYFEEIVENIKDATGYGNLRPYYNRIKRFIFNVENEIGYGGVVVLKKKEYTKGDQLYDGNRLIVPFDFLSLINSAKKVLTDSGGIQKEAYILKIPCLTIRTETEWIETIKGGWNKLIGPENHDFIEQIISKKAPNKNQNIFGENVAKKMVSIINKNLAKY